MRPKGLERMVERGDKKRERRERRREVSRGAAPEAFSIIERSIMAITGATSTAAEAALTKSAPSRRPRFFVFHFDVVVLVAVVSSTAFVMAVAVFCVCVAKPAARCEYGGDVLSPPAAASTGPWTGTGAGVPSFMVGGEGGGPGTAVRVSPPAAVRVEMWGAVWGPAGHGMRNAEGGSVGAGEDKRKPGEEGPRKGLVRDDEVRLDPEKRSQESGGRKGLTSVDDGLAFLTGREKRRERNDDGRN